MKVFISADIEGISSVVGSSETSDPFYGYPKACERMTDEVLAVIDGAFRAGATEILVRDAHGAGTNIDPSRMPPGVKLLRGWSGHPFVMSEGLDKSFDAAMFVGYHAAAGMGGNSLAHTINGAVFERIIINGRIASEFLIYSLAAAYVGVPAVFLSGDRALCDYEQTRLKTLKTVVVKEGLGAASIAYSHPQMLEQLKQGAEDALTAPRPACATLDPHYEMEVTFMRYPMAYKMQYYPGAALKDDKTVIFTTDDYFELLRALTFFKLANH